MFGYYKLRRKIKEYFLFRQVPEQVNYTFKKSNEELFLFGNGYTLDFNINFNDLIGSDIFVCNEFFNHRSYYDLVKNNNLAHFALDSIGSYEKIIPRMEGISVDEAFEKYLHPILEGGAHVVLPDSVTRYVTENFCYAKVEASNSLFKRLTKSNKQIEKNVNLLTNGHTPQGMLLAGILLGYKKIHLHGLEHNYVKDILNKDPKCGTHFYAEPYRQVLELNDGKGLSREAYKIKLSKLLKGNSDVFEVYEQLAEIAKELGVEVIDHSNGSLFMFQDYSLWDLVEPKDKN
jgi:hypothetical protein